MLWLCLHLPQLPLDVLPFALPEGGAAVEFLSRQHSEDLSNERPLAVIDTQQRLLCMNAAARRVGLRPGMSASSARVIAPALECAMRQPHMEHQALHSLAVWAMQFTSKISLLSAQDLLLEIGGSLQLFKSLALLRARIEQGVMDMGYSLQTGVAVTPRAAQVLARAGQPQAALDVQTTRTLLTPLAVHYLDWNNKTRQQIEAVGVRSIGACMALPAAGFRQRYGREKRQDLERLWGLLADPLSEFVPPAQFHGRLELLQECNDSALLLPGFERLFGHLHAELLGRDCAVMQLQIGLEQTAQTVTTFNLGLQSANRNLAHWMALLKEHFQRLQLRHTFRAAVRGISVSVTEFVALEQRQPQLWAQTDAQSRQLLLERLAARLGPSALQSLSTHASHCPEQAWRGDKYGDAEEAVQDQKPRPLWLLETPRPIAVSELHDMSALERLETAWWDTPCNRDYYRARNRQGQRVWVFRNHAQPELWFVHGLFG